MTATRSLLLLALIGAAFLYPLWTTSNIVYSKHSDIIAEHVGIKTIGWDAIRLEGRFPLWNPSMNGGEPAFANPQSMYLFPFDLLFLVLPIGVATNLVILLNFLLAGIAMFLFGRRYFSHPAAALICATAYMLSYRYLAMIYAGWLPKMSMVALTPLLFWAGDLLLERPTRRRTAGIAIVGALTLLQGDMQQLYYATVAGAAWMLLRLTAAGWRRNGGAIFRLVLGGLLAVMLAAPALLPRLEFASLSTRTEPSFEFLLQDSPAPAELRTFFDSHERKANGDVRSQFWENNFYFGYWMAPLWLMAFWEKRSRAALLLLGMGLAVFLCFDTSVLRWIYDHLPGFNLFRRSSRILLLGQFAAVFLAGLGVDALLSVESGRRRRIFFAVSSLAAAGAGWLIPMSWDHRWLALGCVLMAVTGIFSLFPGRRSLALAGLLLLAPILDSALRIEPLLSTKPLAQALPQHAFDDLFNRRYNEGRVLAVGRDPFLGRAALLYSTAAHYGIDMVNGYASLELRDYIEYFTVLEYGTLAALPHHPAVWTDCRQIAKPEMLRALDVRYLIGDPSLNLEAAGLGAERIWEGPGNPVFVFFQGIRVIPLAVWRLGNPLGPAYFATSVHLVGSEAQSLQSLLSASSALDAIVLGFDADARDLEFSGGRAAFLERGWNRYRYRIESEGRNFLILSQVWYPGWTATLDGAPVKLYRTNHALLGCVVPRGTHELVLEMTCLPLRYGLGAAAGAAIAVMVLLIPPASLLSRSKPPPDQPQ
jgi:hypothetical protein